MLIRRLIIGVILSTIHSPGFADESSDTGRNSTHELAVRPAASQVVAAENAVPNRDNSAILRAAQDHMGTRSVLPMAAIDTDIEEVILATEEELRRTTEAVEQEKGMLGTAEEQISKTEGRSAAEIVLELKAISQAAEEQLRSVMSQPEPYQDTAMLRAAEEQIIRMSAIERPKIVDQPDYRAMSEAAETQLIMILQTTDTDQSQAILSAAAEQVEYFETQPRKVEELPDLAAMARAAVGELRRSKSTAGAFNDQAMLLAAQAQIQELKAVRESFAESSMALAVLQAAEGQISTEQIATQVGTNRLDELNEEIRQLQVQLAELKAAHRQLVISLLNRKLRRAGQ